MGITGLIPFLEKASSKVHLRDLRGSTVAVDTYCWLHKGVFACAERLVRGEETTQYIQYCLKYMQMLLSYDIKPILVYDGRHLPAKAITEKRRRESRQQAKKRAAELLRLGQIEEARSHMRRCVDVTHEMALRLIRECRQRNVDCIVAPYEADAQLAWLNKVDLAQYVITEDSDLTLFGARKVIFKLDLTGAGLLVEADRLYLAMGCRKEKYTFDKFRRMCILSGCDYLDSLPGIGLAKACKFILKTEEDNMWRALKKIPQYLNMKTLEVDDEYIEQFLKAEATFKHMYIYNPLKRKMERMHELEEFKTEERYCTNAGTLLDDEQAFQLALGNLNPFTLAQLDNWHPDKDLNQTVPEGIKRSRHQSIWLTNFEPHTSLNGKRSIEASKSCAFLFKKVDFISQTLEDLHTNVTEEQEKPAEEDIFSMYRNEIVEDDIQSSSKRRLEESPSPIHYVEFPSPPTSPNNTCSNRNPFVKTASTSAASPVICERSSFLKMLNSQKGRSEGTGHNPTRQTVEVKSRFFPANVKQATKLSQETEKKDLSNEIDMIESLSQQMQDSQQYLYNQVSPSPKKRKPASEEIENFDVNYDVNNCETLTEVEILPTRKENREMIIVGRISEQAEVLKSRSVNRNSSGDETEIILLSDDDFDVNPLLLPKNKTLEISKFQQRGALRLGLSTPKSATTTPKTIMTKPKTIMTKSKTGNASLEQNQTRLSMFGFQKRPKLE